MQWEQTWDHEGGIRVKDGTQGRQGQNAKSMAWRIPGIIFTLSHGGSPSGSEAFSGGDRDVLYKMYDPPENLCIIV